MGDMLEVSTYASKHQNDRPLYKITSNGFKFQVKSYTTVAIGLSTKPGPDCDVWVVMSISRECHLTWIKRKDHKAKVNRAPNPVIGLAFRRFWLHWGYGDLKLGRGCNTILTYPCELDLRYVVFSSGSYPLGGFDQHTAAALWRIEMPPILEKPRIRPITGGELRWVPIDDSRRIPDGALVGGYENEPLYIIRAYNEGALIPGKFMPSKDLGYVPVLTFIAEKNQFEVLCGFDCAWVPSTGDKIPVNAVVGGLSEDQKEKFYIGRGFVEGHVIPGKVQVSRKATHHAGNTCFVPYYSRAHPIANFEILVSPFINARVANGLFSHTINLDAASREFDDDDPALCEIEDLFGAM